jgi:triacylglycerol lipase
MDKRQLTERDICSKFITPAVTAAGWDPLLQIREEVSFTKGRIIVRGKLVTRGKAKRADYVLYYKPNIPLALIEAKDNTHSVGAGPAGPRPLAGVPKGRPRAIDLVDPELRALALSPLVPLTAETLTRRRVDALALANAVAKPDLPDIVTGETHVKSAFGAKPIRVPTYRPIRSDAALPVIVHIHGGGFIMGAPEMKDVENRLFASELRCAIYSVDHRLVPEAPHPAPVEDIYSVFVWLHANASQLGLDPDRIGIKGESGGGGFAAGAALYARERSGPKFAFQHLIYPMIDDRTAIRGDLHPYVGEFIWTQANNYFGWRSLLGEEPGSAGVSPYAAAARATDVSALPPTYISVGGLDLFLEENMTYADRLSRAGVPVEFHLYPRAFHGFYRATNARVTRQAEHDAREALRRFLHG